MKDLVGKTLKQRYRIDAFLGRGGMAEVYRAFDLRRSYLVAIKVMRADLAEDIEFVDRFRREAKSLYRLAHENIIRFYEFARERHLAFLVMDYVDGITLRLRILEAEGPMPLDEARDILGQVSAALHYAHEEGIIHRDVKPGNIMLRSDGRVFVADFGIAKAVDSSTMTAIMPGTMPYMSPEQCRSQPLNRRTDVYSLGIVAYEMLTGRRPFRGETKGAHGTSKRERTRWEQLYAPPPPLRGVNPETPPHVVQAVRRALSKNPTDRPQTVMDFCREFVQGDVGAPAVSATPPSAPRAAPLHPAEDTEAARLYDQAMDAVSREEWGLAIQCLNAILAVNPGYRDTIAQLTEANRQKRIADLFAQAQAGFEQEDWTEAVALSAEIIATDPGHLGARELLRRARTVQKLESRYARAMEAMQTEDREGAVAALEEIIALDPSYRDAQALLDRVREEQARRQQIAGLRAEGKGAFEDGSWERAVSCFEEILSLDPGQPDVRDLVEKAGRELETDRHAQGLFVEAQAHAEREEWTAAAKAVEGALALRPNTPAYLPLLERAQAELALAALYIAAQAAIEDGEWDTAIRTLQQVLERAPDHREAQRLLKEAQAAKAGAERLAALYKTAATAFQQKEWAGAVASWQQVLHKDPEYRDAAGRLADAKKRLAEQRAADARKAQIARLVGQAETHEGAMEWEQAVGLWEEARALAPDRKELGERLAAAQAEMDKQRRVSALYRSGQEAWQREDREGAIATLEEAVALDPSYRDAQALLDRVREEQARAQQIAGLRSEGREAFKDGSWERAVSCFEEILSLDPGQPDVRDLVERAGRELETDRRAQGLFVEAQAHAEREEWTAAAKAVEGALVLRPDTPAYLPLLERARGELALAALYKTAATAFQQKEWAGAVASWQQVLHKDPEYRDAAGEEP